MTATGKSKTTVWRWQARFAEAGVGGLLEDKTRPPGKAPIADARVAGLVRLTHEEIERDGGNGGQEIRNWVAMLGAVPGWKGEVLAYEPVAEWITGCATVWVHP